MGSALSIVLADIVMNELICSTLNKIQYDIPFFKRYVDDIITAVPKNEINSFCNIFNTFHPKLQFTYEIENDSREIDFLDIKIKINYDNSITTLWCTKKTWSARYLNFNSFSSIKHKKNVVTAILDRAITFTDLQYRQAMIKKVYDIFLLNNYPIQF